MPACDEIPMMHVTLVSAEFDTPWTFIAPTLKLPLSLTAMQQKNPAGTRFEDISATTYALLPPAPMTLSPVPLRHGDSRIDAHFIADHDDTPTFDMSVRALSTAAIIRVPADTDYTSISMLCVHMLHTAKSPLSSLDIADEDTLLDIIHNFHELAVLAKVKWRLDNRANPVLPFHLAALEVIDQTLAGELPLV
jgi:mediator of RNA polymerase II transcription subunit 13, fungi type